MADALDAEAKRRGISRPTLVAYYMKLHNMSGAEGTQAPAQPQPRPAAPAQHPQYQGGILQYLLNSLGGNPSGK